MMFYPTLMSGFAKMQTDPIDTRLNNYFLEHSFQFFFNSHYLGKLWSPTFFYPYPEVLAFSDNLFGTAPIYWFFRIFSTSDLAFQLWMITVSALNFTTFALVMRKFKVNHLLSVLASFLFAFSLPRIAQIGHQQLLPQFFTPLAFLVLWEFIKKPNHIKLVLLLLLTYLQLLAGIYLGWFWVFSLMIFFGVIFTLELEIKVKLIAYWDKNKKEIIGIILSWLFLTIITFLPYIKAIFVLGSRSYGGVSVMIPRISSWLFPPAGNFWHPFLSWISKDLPMSWEHHLFIGFTLMILTAISLSIFLKKRHLFNTEQTLVIKSCFLVFIAIFALSLMLPFGISLWRIVYIIIPGASVIRAVSRIWTIAYFYLFIATFVCFDIYLKSLSLKRKWSILMTIIILFLGITEQITTNLPSFEKRPVLTQVSEIRELIQNKCKIAYVLPNITQDNKSLDDPNSNMSTMWAGIEANVPVINGYSGNLPPQYNLNVFDNVQTLAVTDWLSNSGQKIQDNLCMIIHKNFKFKDGLINILSEEQLLQKYDSNNFNTYVLTIPIPKIYKQDIKLINRDKNIKIINQTVEAIVTIQNNSTFSWSGQNEHPINFSYRWFDDNGNIAEFDGDGIRTPLPAEIKPGQKIALLVTIKTPSKAGKYKLFLTMVEEDVTWFNDKISDATSISLEVISP